MTPPWWAQVLAGLFVVVSLWFLFRGDDGSDDEQYYR